MNDYVTICLVKVGADVVPVYAPSGMAVNVMDLIFFEYEGERRQADVLFAADYQRIDERFWTAITIACQMAPIRAYGCARINVFRWEEEKHERVIPDDVEKAEGKDRTC
jgi:hypothetical protein